MARHYESPVLKTENLAPGVRLLSLQRPAELTWLPGQGVVVEAGSPALLCRYSIATAPELPAHFEIVADLSSGGACARYIGALEPGDIVRYQAPIGEFSFDRAPGAPLALIGYEVGIAALRPIVQRLFQHRLLFPVRLHHFVKDTSLQLFRKEFVSEVFRRENFEYEVLFDIPMKDYLYGRYVAGTAERKWHFYVCGPNPDVQHVAELLRGAGYDPAGVHVEQW
ncbi:MAG: hypothetical protein KatS3mg077_2527 [Candidatus Binatia bacterium]|nr:MAG: hypothetical protein KatS3mg077_2527 [Candidatus Binatia bacterium]